jgi:uncharacterized protein YcbK (DUF882 family)
MRALALLGTIGLATTAATSLAARPASNVATVAPTFALPVLDELSTAAASADDDLRSLLSDSLFGRSGKLRVRFLSAAAKPIQFPVLSRLFGDSAIRRPGIYALPDSAVDRPLAFVTMLPFTSKASGRIGTYRIGFWPGERRRLSSPAYRNPEGFIEVTQENQDLQVSEHFRLRDFLTKDQRAVWPKYLVLRTELVDKLELVIDDLQAHGVRVERVSVMSGFRTPQYNAGGGDPRGRANNSRHMYGDAADVFVDNDGNGRMDDLNRDGLVDHRDAQVILKAVERVERAHPSLVGGVGVYRATSAHGPFAHVDVRGNRARWGLQG